MTYYVYESNGFKPYQNIPDIKVGDILDYYYGKALVVSISDEYIFTDTKYKFCIAKLKSNKYAFYYSQNIDILKSIVVAIKEIDHDHF